MTAPETETKSIKAYLGEIETLARLYFAALLGISCIYAIGSGLWLNNAVPIAIVVGLSLIVIACWAVVGGVLGFLFGIPRLLQRWAAPPPAAPASSSTAESKEVARRYLISNSNLEDISDWLTKIIVGLGLINLTKIPAYIDVYGSKFVGSTKFLAADGLGGAYAFFILLTAAAGTAGFLFFYIETRTRITLLLMSIEEAQDKESEKLRNVAAAPQFQSPPLDGRRVLSAAMPAPQTWSDPNVLSMVPTLADPAEVWAAWAAAKARAGELADAERGWKTAIAKDRTDNPSYREKLAEVLEALRKYGEAVDWYGSARTESHDSPDLRERELIASLYTQGNYERSIKLAEDWIAGDPVSARNPWVKLWRIAAYGQKHAALLNFNPEAARAIRDKVMALTKELIAQVPDSREEVRRGLCRMLDPVRYKGEAEDNDLVSFKDDAEFVALLGCTEP